MLGASRRRDQAYPYPAMSCAMSKECMDTSFATGPKDSGIIGIWGRATKHSRDIYLCSSGRVVFVAVLGCDRVVPVPMKVMSSQVTGLELCHLPVRNRNRSAG